MIFSVSRHATSVANKQNSSAEVRGLGDQFVCVCVCVCVCGPILLAVFIQNTCDHGVGLEL
jgi:hypothetical protein